MIITVPALALAIPLAQQINALAALERYRTREHLSPEEQAVTSALRSQHFSKATLLYLTCAVLFSAAFPSLGGVLLLGIPGAVALRAQGHRL